MMPEEEKSGRRDHLDKREQIPQPDDLAENQPGVADKHESAEEGSETPSQGEGSDEPASAEERETPNDELEAAQTKAVPDISDLQRAIQDAQSLLHFAAKQSIKLRPETTTTIVKAKNYFDTSKWTPELEVEFWNALVDLNSMIYPVTIETYNATLGSGGKFFNTVVLNSYGFGFITVVSLFLIIWMQIHSLNGQSLTSEIDQMIATRSDIEQELRETDARLAISSRILEQPSRNFSQEQTTNGVTAEVSNLKATSVLQSEKLVRVERDLYASFLLLAHWLSRWEWVVGVLPSPMSWWERWISSEEEIAAEKIMFENIDEMSDEISLISVKSTLQALNSYFLPALYGLLGACAYILRTLAREVKTFTLSETFGLRSLLRLPLGVLSGIVVGWFLTPETLPSAFSAIQPLALAFLAGYSVELVFAGLDRLISTFTEETRAGQRIPT